MTSIHLSLKRRAIAAAVVVGLCSGMAFGGRTMQNDNKGILAPKTWSVIGPFDNSSLKQRTATGANRAGWDVDFLAELGGEANAQIGAATKLKAYPEASVQTIETDPFYKADLTHAYPVTALKLAYLYGTFESSIEADLWVRFGSDDAAKVWVNGKQVYNLWSDGRGADPNQERFFIHVVKGENRVLIKLDNAGGDWSSYFAAYTPEAEQEALLQNARESLFYQDIVPDGYGSYLLSSNSFPQLSWKSGALMLPLLKSLDLKVRWFDEQANEVKEAAKPGRYIAYIEAETKEGLTFKRMLHFYRPHNPAIEPLFSFPPRKYLPIKLGFDKTLGYDLSAWASVAPSLSEVFAYTTQMQFVQKTEGSGLLALIEESKPGDAKVVNPIESDLRVLDLELKIKRKLQGVTGSPLKAPTKAERPATTIHYGTCAEAGMKPEVVAKLDKICKEWAEKGGMPFTAVVARKGVVFMHKGYGILDGKKIDKNALFMPASIGKIMCGLMFLQYMDQGLLDPEMPLGKFLPDYATTGDKAVTFRQCFTHMSGIAGHGTYSGLWNPYLDNSFAVQKMPYVMPGVRHQYGGDGNNLAAKAMEVIAGKPFIRLLQDNLFVQIGAKVSQDDLGYINSISAFDLAKLGQMMLNGGSYGDKRFFGPATFQKMLPVRLADYNPKMGSSDIEWGLCLTWMFEPDIATPQNPDVKKGSYLGPRVIGHGSATASILRVDLDNGFVVVMGRYGEGDKSVYDDCRVRFMKALKEGIAE